MQTLERCGGKTSDEFVVLFVLVSPSWSCDYTITFSGTMYC
jgi:hypothetical protein